LLQTLDYQTSVILVCIQLHVASVCVQGVLLLIRLHVAAVYIQGVDVQALLDDVRKLKIIAKGHERRIKYLEDRLTAYEDVAACIDDHIDEQME